MSDVDGTDVPHTYEWDFDTSDKDLQSWTYHKVRELFEEDKNPANEFGGPVSDIVPTGAYAHMNAMMLMKVNTLKGVKNMRNNDKFSEDIGVYWDKQKKKWMTKDPA